jgi:uncharacterized protein (TIGR02145 family)
MLMHQGGLEMRYFFQFVVALTICFSLSIAEAQNKVVVIPMGGAVGDAVPSDVLWGKTFSSKAGKGLTGTLELPLEPEVEVPVVTSEGQVWMALNLGASQLATSSTDSAAYGTLYQWGRFGDGHEYRSSSTTTDLSSSSDVPGHGSFILTSSDPYDWRTPQNGNLWQGVAGINNPCPAGFRLPTKAEWEIERASWVTNDSAGAFASPLKLVPAGDRYSGDGALYGVGSYGYYWGSTVDEGYSRGLYFYSGGAGMGSYNRAFGFSVRCIKD